MLVLLRFALYFLELYVRFWIFVFLKVRTYLIKYSPVYREFDNAVVSQIQNYEVYLNIICQYPFVRSTTRMLISVLVFIRDYPLTPSRISTKVEKIIKIIQQPFVKSIQQVRKEPSQQPFYMRKRSDSLRSMDSFESIISSSTSTKSKPYLVKSPAKSF